MTYAEQTRLCNFEFPIPIELQVDNKTAIAYHKSDVNRTKLKHIDARQECGGPNALERLQINETVSPRPQTKEEYQWRICQTRTPTGSHGCIDRRWQYHSQADTSARTNMYTNTEIRRTTGPRRDR